MSILANYSKQNMISIIDFYSLFHISKGCKDIFMLYWHKLMSQCSGIAAKDSLFLQSELQDEIPEARKRRTSWLLVSSVHVILTIMLLDVILKIMLLDVRDSGGRGFCKNVLGDAKKLRYNHPVLSSLSCCRHRWWRCQNIPSETNPHSLYCTCTFHGWVNPIWNDVVVCLLTDVRLLASY